MLEVLRCYPPVWSLPRQCPVSKLAKSSGVADMSSGSVGLRVDVISCNGATEAWPSFDPCRPVTKETRLATFGLGDRSCPGGTAALHAAFTMLRYIFRNFHIKSKGVEHFQAAYLAPTLVCEGEQMVTVWLQPQLHTVSCDQFSPSAGDLAGALEADLTSIKNGQNPQ